MSLVKTRRDLLESVDKLVRKPAAIQAKDLHDILIGLSTILTESFGEAVLLTPVFTNRSPIAPVSFPDLSEETREKERLQFLDFLKMQPGVLNVGYNSDTKKFLLKEDQAAWEAWIYRAQLQLKQQAIKLHSEEQLQRFNAHYLTTPNGKKVHETVMHFWHPDYERFLIPEIQQAFTDWLKDNV